jgi:hypothetical protein
MTTPLTQPVRTLAPRRRGIALISALLLSLAVAAIALGMVMMTMNASLVAKSNERGAVLDDIATAGLEETRSALNGKRTLYPSTSYTTIENNVTVKDASGTAIPNVTRSVYVGPTGITSGQFGVIGTIISYAKDSYGNKAIRRLDVNQESFSKFGYFTNSELDTLGNTIVFGGGDQLRGPVHSNDQIKVNTGSFPQVTFFDQVTSAYASILNQTNGQFNKTPQTAVARIPMPTVADLAKLDSLALVGNTKFTGTTTGDAGEATTRIKFLVISIPSLGADSLQGFFRVYQGLDAKYVSASLPAANPYLESSQNCGDSTATGFMAASDHGSLIAAATHGHGILATGPLTANGIKQRDSSLTTNTNVASAGGVRITRCYLGGDSILTAPAGLTSGVLWLTTGHRDGGAWVAAPASIQSAVLAMGAPITTRLDRNYLFPLNRQYNPNFKGVISVAGKVTVDGIVHGRVTVAATGNIVFTNDVRYMQDAATRDCATGDIIGYFSGQSLIVANNTINAPQTYNTNASQSSSASGTFRSYEGLGVSTDETIQGFFLTLKTFGAEENGTGSQSDQPCAVGSTSNAGRGCLNTYGGIIQGNRGAVGLTSGAGYSKRYQYDACGATNPPPYYPTTGIFKKNRFSEIDPTRFSIANWFAANQR